MSRRHFDRTENAELRAKIDEAKRRLPLPQLLALLALGECAKKSAHCPFHDDEHESFSVFQSNDGKGWQWKCNAGCGYGDEIAFLVKHFGISRREAITRYLQMAGFPRSQSSKSHVSEGQMLDAEVDEVLKERAAQNACTAEAILPQRNISNSHAT